MESIVAMNPHAGQGEIIVPRITVLSRPVCGAPLRQDTQRCDYCGSAVLIEFEHPHISPQSLNMPVIHERIAEYRTVIRCDAADAASHYGLGIAYFNLGLLDDAADALQDAARLTSENPYIQTQLAIVHADRAAKGQAGAELLAWNRLNRVLILRPTLVDALLLKADLHLRRQEWHEAA